MRKTIISLMGLALLASTQASLAASHKVTLVAHNQRSSSGTLSTLKWNACTPVQATSACYSTTNAWTLANVQGGGSNAVWHWNDATQVLTSSGRYQATSFVSSNANGSPVISDKVNDMVIDVANTTTTASTYFCIEGTFLAGVGANGCLNVNIGDDFTNQSSAVYNVGGDANCVQRTIAGDDFTTGNVRTLQNTLGGGGCDPGDGAFNLWTKLTDATNTGVGGQLILSNGIAISAAGTNYMTFAVVAEAVNDGPVSALETVTKSIDVLANDTDFAGTLTVAIVTPPTKGTATVVGSPGAAAGISINYTADAGQTGPDSFTYSVTDGSSNTGTATVSITVLAGGANNDTATTTRNHAAFPINVGANDGGFTDPVTITIVSGPDQGGTATPPAGPVSAATAEFSYAPGNKPNGTPTYVETFTYQITDGSVTDTATVTVTVVNNVPVAGNVNLAPSTQGVTPASATANTFNAATLSGNNLGDSGTITTTDPANGSASVSGNVVTYTPDAAYFKGPDSFQYTITDADGETATGTVNVNIADLTPVVAAASISMTKGTASATKALSLTYGNGSPAQHTLAISAAASSGTCTLSGNSVVYTPNSGFSGSDSCTIGLTDEDGAGQTGTGVVSITVNEPASSGGTTSDLLPGGGGALDAWGLSLLAAGSWLRRKRRGK